ncbi:MAG: hypothetical protein KatS3mg057_0112 [Herpetosiphonaceae bacterium]|nr:MAG: hypothetical protein KatS3mg057_0112 [Herpetosiphonaceae bacterium]
MAAATVLILSIGVVQAEEKASHREIAWARRLPEPLRFL